MVTRIASVSMNWFTGHNLVLLALSCLMLGGCQPKVYLMPSPVGLEPDNKIFTEATFLTDDNYLYTLYATNRKKVDPHNSKSGYTIFPSDEISLGWVAYRVGGAVTGWEEFLEKTITPDRPGRLLLSKINTREVVSRDLHTESSEIGSREHGYFHVVNNVLAQTVDKDIIVYVHGANNNFYRATAQGAQFFHFTGHNSIIITFCWPSAENILRYKKDVQHAQETAPAFARLIELLATHTSARNINILAYSAGAKVATLGLAHLRDMYPEETPEDLRTRMRIGEVYFAAPDTAFEPFVERYPSFKDIVHRTTINLNMNDSVLKMSARINKGSRLGTPDLAELDETQRQTIVEAMNSPQLNILDVGASAPLSLGGAHNSWYGHPWVSMDVLLLFLLNLDPLERGLDEYWVDGIGKIYRFPDDYVTRIQKYTAENGRKFQEKFKQKDEQLEN